MKGGRIGVVWVAALLLAGLLFARAAVCSPTPATAPEERAGLGNWLDKSVSERPRRVLLLNSYHPGYTWNIPLLAGIHKVLDRSDLPLHIRYEYMDAKHDPTDAFVGELRELYRRKYRNERFDVIIASDNDAFNFLRRYRDELFPGAPVSFCGVNGFDPSWMRGFPNATGTGETFDLPGTIRLALRLHPAARHVVLVGGVDTTSRTNTGMVRELMPRLFPGITLLDYSGLDIAPLRRRLEEAPRDAVLLYISYYLTPDGTRIPVQESIRLVARLSGLPMYTAWSYLLSDGMVGGQMLRAEDQGETAAALAMRILHGERPEAIPVRLTSPTWPMFDAAALRRFGISRSELPDDAVIVNEDMTLFERYRTVIVAAALFMLYQTGAIIWLALNVQQRKRAEAQLRQDQKLRVQLEEQLFHAQKMEAIDTFAGGIAHDFNNILEVMSGCCELALEELPKTSPAGEDLRQALGAARRGQALTRQLLDFSRRSPAHLERMNLSALVSENSGLLRQLLPAGTELSLDIRPTPPILGDANKLTQVLMNLCINAGHAIREQAAIDAARGVPGRDGVLAVRVEAAPFAGVPEQGAGKADKQAPPAGEVRLLVSDSGCGIPAEVVSRIFDPFFTTRPKGVGTGLGLSVTLGIARLHGGRIEVSSVPGQGTTFTVSLPAAPAADAAGGDSGPGGEAPAGGGAGGVCSGHEQLLLVDDEAAVREVMGRRLEQLGYGVIRAVSGLDGLERLNGRHDIRLVITDLDMPVMSGLAFARQIRTIYASPPPVLLVTGVVQVPGDGELQAAGIAAVLHKPVPHKLLAQTVRRILDGGAERVPAGQASPAQNPDADAAVRT